DQLGRRNLIGAAAWSVPAIALMTASPAYAASTPGVIAFLDPENIIGSGYTANLAVQLTPAAGGQLPASVNVAYSKPGVVDGPAVVPTGGGNLVTIPVTGLDTNDSTDITVSASGYLSATMTLRVTYSDGAISILMANPFNLLTSNTIDVTPNRVTLPDGTIIDQFTGQWLNNSIASTNTMTPKGLVLGSGLSSVTGSMEYRLQFWTTGSPNLVWKTQDGFPYSGMPIDNTEQTSQSVGAGSLTGAGIVPAVRAKASNTTNPGGDLIILYTFARFPKYQASLTLKY
ncbi:hypothetical protein ABCS02_28930, partial [Microbacterium sp. X-17]|uniref:hypothetical protein n=1 Tax=Microbacterium sp. X-17 TaxID=3144404 RepID=UPI0031F5140C